MNTNTDQRAAFSAYREQCQKVKEQTETFARKLDELRKVWNAEPGHRGEGANVVSIFDNPRARVSLIDDLLCEARKNVGLSERLHDLSHLMSAQAPGVE